mgnify:CR=1 FL=1
MLDIKLAVSEYEEEKMACFMEQGEAVGAVSWHPIFCLLSGNADSFLLRRDRQVAGTCPAGKVGESYPETEIDAEGRDISLFLPIAKATISVCIRINSRCE